MGIKYLGKKTWLLPLLKECPEIFEPFCGSAVVSLEKSKRCYLNDSCQPLINLYTELVGPNRQDFLDRTAALMAEHLNSSLPRDNYYRLRARFNSQGQTDPSLFFFILEAGFNGLWRQGAKGCSTTYGGPRKLSTARLLSIPQHKIGAVSARSWKDCRAPNQDCLIFADPPYSDSFTGYNFRGWTERDDAELIQQLSEVKNPVILTMSFNMKTQQLLHDKGFEIKMIDRSYKVGGPNKKDSSEMIAFNELGRNFLNV